MFLQSKRPSSTPQVIDLLSVLDGDMGRTDLQKILNLSDREYFRRAYLQPAIEQGLVAMEYPQPNHPRQRYYLTPKGIELKIKNSSGDTK